MSTDLTSAARGLGFTGALPSGATDIQKDGSGHYKITVGNEVKIFNADGTLATDNSSASASQGAGSGGSASQAQGSGSGRAASASHGSGSGGSASQPQNGLNDNIWSTQSYSAGGGYNINPADIGRAAMNTDAILQFGSEVPFGLGGQLAQGAISQNILDYVGAAQFNFNFDNYFAQSPQQDTQQASQSGSVVSGGTQVTDSDGNSKTVDQLAEDGGYSKTATNGVYKKGGKYYKYDTNAKEFVELSGTEATKAKEADDKKAADKAKDAKAKEIEAEAASIAEDLYDAMKGAGTKNDKLQQTIERINKDNVMAVIKAWDENFADGMDGETLIQSIQGEHHTGWFGNSQEKQENLILNALVARAEELGLVNEAHAARAKVNSEHSAWFTSDDTVRAAIENLHAKIKAKEAETEGS